MQVSDDSFQADSQKKTYNFDVILTVHRR